MVTLSIRSDGIGFAVILFLGGVLAAELVVVVDLGSYPSIALAGGCSTSRTIVWSSLPSVSRSKVDLRRIGSGRDRADAAEGERYACDDDESAASAIAAITSIAVNFMIGLRSY